jgi:hypothetical protein
LTQKKPKPTEPRGPDPETLKIEGDWEDAVRKALKKKRPPAPQKQPRKKPQ